MKKLKIVWDIKNHYWYPLEPDCRRKDLIAFKDEYFDDEDIATEDKILNIQEFLLNHDEMQIFEKEEDGSVYIIDTTSFAPYGIECFWFNEKMNWIIYASHEESITFGGKAFIKYLKDKWKDWEDNLYP